MDVLLNLIPSWLKNPLITGFLLDIILGDPYWLPHPIKLFGKLIGTGETYLNKGKYRLLKGGILTFILVTSVVSFISIFLFLIKDYPSISFIVESILVFWGIANRSLITECLKVEKKLKENGIVVARKQLSMIVGRDTDRLTVNQVRTATLETLSENLSDGVIAPLLYYAIGGIPLMFAYKMVNTLDSMIGYKNEQFSYFGRIAARTDDILNFIPARLTAFLMVVVTFSWRGFLYVFKYGNKHSSPNAGYPEAALSGILNCQFGGANYYHGKLLEKPFIGRNEKKLSGTDIYKGCIVNMLCTTVFIISIFIVTI